MEWLWTIFNPFVVLFIGGFYVMLLFRDKEIRPRDRRGYVIMGFQVLALVVLFSVSIRIGAVFFDA